jgi:uncharacterized protein
LIRYLETSLLIAALTLEPETKRIQRWLDDQQQVHLAISDWVIAEFSAALSVKLRMRGIDNEGRALALSAFAEMASDQLEVFAVSRACFRIAARLADRQASGLRGSDALHLAICQSNGATLHTLDRRLAKAAAALAVPATLV